MVAVYVVADHRMRATRPVLVTYFYQPTPTPKQFYSFPNQISKYYMCAFVGSS